MKATLESLKDMIDVNTVVGDPVETPDGQVIIPVSRVSVGFAAGGSEFGGRGGGQRMQADDFGDEQDGGHQGGGLPFGGGSGAGISVQPLGFLVVGKENIRMLPVDQRQGWEKLVDLAPQLVERIGARVNQPGQQRRGGNRQQEDAGGENGGGEGNGMRRRGRQSGDRLARRVVDAIGEEGDDDDYR